MMFRDIFPSFTIPEQTSKPHDTALTRPRSTAPLHYLNDLVYLRQMKTLYAAVVASAGTWLVVLAVLAIADPERTKVFLGRFASSAFSHYLEVFVRILVGSAFIIHSPYMKFSAAFNIFG